MSEKLLLIDGHSMLNRAFYGLPDLTNSEGLHTGAVYGFLNILFRILDEEQPEYLTVAFDLHAPTFRHKMYDAYKGTRKPMPSELREQVPLIKDVLKAMGVEIVTKEGFEADDLLGTLAKQAEREGVEVTILSGDRDLLQLASDHIQIRIPKTKGGKTIIEDYHAAEVLETYQLSPLQIIELKALMGDSADNIPGIPGVGEKTATKILLAYGNIEEAYAHVDEIKPKKAMEALRDHYDLAVLSKTLAAINTESPVSFDAEKMKIQDLYTKEAYEWFKRLDFKNLLSRFDGDRKEQISIVDPKLLVDFQEITAVIEKACRAQMIGLDLLSEEGEAYGLAIVLSEEEMYYIPSGGFMTSSYLITTAHQLCETDALVCAFRLKDMPGLSSLSRTDGFFDAHVAAYLLNPLKSEYTYDDIAKEYADLMLPSKEEILDGKKVKSLAELDDTLASKISTSRAFSAYASKRQLMQRLQEEKMEKLFYEVEMPLLFTLQSMEDEGIRIMPDELKAYGDMLQLQIDQLEKQIYKAADEEFNINSPKQLGVILFEKMALPGGKKTKSGFSTAADVLEKLAPEAPIVADILEYRQLTKLKSTYADGLMQFVEAEDRIHTKFHQTITATGRISSTEPNLQNIPIRMELGRQIRKVFVPKEGYVFVDADYSQIELRVLAHLSEDENLIKAYKEASDIHRMTASQVFHVPFDEVTALQRRNAKAVNFGIVYGISSFGLSQDLSITRKEADSYIKSYFDTYPGIKHFLDQAVEDAKEKGYAKTLFGRRRPMPELKSGNFMQRSFGERVAMNAPVQGTAADIIKIAMIRVDRRLKEEGLKARLILQIHDELLIETPEEELDVVTRILTEEMKGAADLSVELEIDLHTGKSWYEAK